jgi:ferric-dicitrate binding protein FerR (iron transport regulator)
LFSTEKAEKRIFNIIEKKKKKLQLLQLSFKVAAITIVLIASSFFLNYYFQKSERVINDVPVYKLTSKAADYGNQLRVKLPDGSVAWLNAGSRISFPEKFGSGQRLVKLSGEAYFEVTEDTEHPFVVEFNQFKVTVLGTSFNINSYNEENVITVATGKVKIEKQNKEDLNQGVLLFPNQQVICNSQSENFEIREVTPGNFINWTTGTIQFNNSTLKEALETLERWYDIAILLECRDNTNIRINGGYKDKKLYSILDGLSYMYDLNYYFKNDSTVVINDRNKK